MRHLFPRESIQTLLYMTAGDSLPELQRYAKVVFFLLIFNIIGYFLYLININ